MVTVKEFAEKNHIHLSGVYAKIKRRQQDLEGHIFRISDKFILDDCAEEILKPGEKHTENLNIKQTAKAYSEMEYRLNRQIDILKNELFNAEEEAEYQKMCAKGFENRVSQLEAECENLRAENERLQQINADLSAKPKGLFFRK